MKARARVVLAVDRERIAMAVAVGEAVILEGEMRWTDNASLESSARQLMERVASGRPGRGVDLDILMRRPLATRKALFGVDAATAVEEVRSRLWEEPHRYFLGEEGAIVTSVPALQHGAWWATGADREILRALLSACERLSVARCRVMAVDSSDDAALASHSRAAAIQRIVDPLALDPLAAVRRAQSRHRRLRLVTIALLSGLTVSAVGPALLHASLFDRERAALSALQVTVNETHAWARAMAAQRLEDRAKLAALSSRAPLLTPLIGSLGAALPDSAVVISLAVDTTAGTVVVLAPPGVEILGAVSRLPSITDARLNGTVTRERLLDREVNRTTVAFRIQHTEAPR